MIKHGHHKPVEVQVDTLTELIDHIDSIDGWDTSITDITREQKQLLFDNGEYSFVPAEVCPVHSYQVDILSIDRAGVWHYHKLKELEDNESIDI